MKRLSVFSFNAIFTHSGFVKAVGGAISPYRGQASMQKGECPDVAPSIHHRHNFGFSENDAVGTSLDIIIPGSLREAHWRSFHRALADHITKYAGQVLPTKPMRSDGTQIYAELSSLSFSM